MEEYRYQKVILEVALPATYQAANKNMDSGEVTYKDIEQTPLEHIEELLQYDDHGLILLSATANDLLLRPGGSLESTIEEFIDYAKQAPNVLSERELPGGKPRLEGLKDLYTQAEKVASRVAGSIGLALMQEKEEKKDDNK